MKDYPILFDVNFNVSRMDQFFNMISEGGYIDDETVSYWERGGLLFGRAS